MHSSRSKVHAASYALGAQQQIGEISSEKPHDKKWTLARLFFSWLACCLTPVCIGIVQAFELTNPLVQMSVACDLFFCLDALQSPGLLCRIWPVLRHLLGCLRAQTCGGISGKGAQSRGVNSKKRLVFAPSPFAISSPSISASHTAAGKDRRLVAPLLRAALPLLLPGLARLCGASDLLQAWLSLPRLLRLQDLVAIYHTLKYKFAHLAALHNDTVNRCIMTAGFTSIHASTLAACWFYLACRRQHQCSADEDSWVGRDDVLREQDVFSIYIRSLHFIIQTLFTVGYGELACILTHSEPQHHKISLCFSLSVISCSQATSIL